MYRVPDTDTFSLRDVKTVLTTLNPRSNNDIINALRICFDTSVDDLFDINYATDQYGNIVKDSLYRFRNYGVDGCAVGTSDHPRWDSYNSGTYGIDAFGLALLPSGQWLSAAGGYVGLGKTVALWTSDEAWHPNFAVGIGFGYTHSFMAISGDYEKTRRLAIRAMRDAEVAEQNYKDGHLIINAYTDGSGNNYNAVKIGNQIWINENLYSTKSQDGFINYLGSISYYNDDSANSVYGRLYAWSVIHDWPIVGGYGWRVPTQSDFEDLREYIYNKYYIGYANNSIPFTTFARYLKSCRQVNHPLG